MARLPFATRMVLKLDVLSVRWTGKSFFIAAFANIKGVNKTRRAPALILETIGRKSGLRRSVVLPYYSFDGHMIVVGSKGGADDEPYWVRNLRKTPEATALINRKKRAVKLRIADAEERARLWPQIIAFAPSYDEYQKGTKREIPLLLIE